MPVSIICACGLHARKPDVVGLQEIKITDEEFPTEFFTELGYHMTTYGQKAWNGVAVLSRSPAEVLDRGLPGEEAFGSRLLRVKVDDLQFTTVYCPNGKDLGHDDFPNKLAWFDSLLRYWSAQDRSVTGRAVRRLQRRAQRSRQLAEGDTEQPDLPHESRTRPICRAARPGPRRSVPPAYPDKKTFSWWDYRGGAFHKGQGLRIDMVLATAPVAQRVKDVVIDRDYRKKVEGFISSDHAPVFADLD